MSHSTAGADSPVKTLHKSEGGSSFPKAALLAVSFSNFSGESGIPLAIYVLVKAPLIPEVALVELPPQNGFFSKRTTLAPCSNTVWAADKPARPPPITIT